MAEKVGHLLGTMKERKSVLGSALASEVVIMPPVDTISLPLVLEIMLHKVWSSSQDIKYHFKDIIKILCHCGYIVSPLLKTHQWLPISLIIKTKVTVFILF
jgi:hypothetical protein